MNLHEAKSTLLLYRPGTADTEDPQIADALALAKRDPALALWLEEHCALQAAIRAKFRQIPTPEGLQAQIISEDPSRTPANRWRQPVLVATLAVLVVTAGLVAFFQRPPPENSFQVFRSRMVGEALRVYVMDFQTNDLAQIRDYFVQHKVPADYSVPAGLQKVAVVGCAIEPWQAAQAAMICFHTGKQLPKFQQSDLWLFVAPRSLVKNPPGGQLPVIKQISSLMTASWTQGDFTYVLATEGDEANLRRFL